MLIQVISSTTREGRFSERVATWETGQLANRVACDVEPIDLREYPLPFFDGVAPARAPREYASPELEQLGRRLGRGDGYIALTAESSRAARAGLKTWRAGGFGGWGRKPMSFV